MKTTNDLHSEDLQAWGLSVLPQLKGGVQYRSAIQTQ